MKKQKQFLVLLDASERAMDTIRYVAECEPFREACLVLFYVYSDIPEYYWDLDNDPQRTDTLQGFRAWQKKRIEKINAFMEEAKGSLTDNGFSEENVAIRIHQRERGVARDILDEAGKGYDGVILRRRGMGRFKGAALGS